MFLELRGYDEEGVWGSGSQDIDFINRCKARGRGQVFCRFTRKPSTVSHEVVGYPVPNDPTDKRKYR